MMKKTIKYRDADALIMDIGYLRHLWGLDDAETELVIEPPSIEKIIFNDPVTVVFWSDGDKTLVRCNENDKFSEYYGVVAAITKKFVGNAKKIRKIIDEKSKRTHKCAMQMEFEYASDRIEKQLETKYDPQIAAENDLGVIESIAKEMGGKLDA